MNKNILITGANGQLGNEIRVQVGENPKDNYFFTDVNELDITNKEMLESFISNNKIDVVVNCAAYTQVDKAEDDAEIADLINNNAVQNIADTCEKNNASIIHISTDYVFDGSNNFPYTENMPTSPLGVYGKTKLSGENAVIESKCHFIILRTSWLYSSFGGNFVKTMQKLTSERESLNVVFDQVGTPTYAADLAKVIVDIIANNSYKTISGIYHYSNEGVCSWFDFAVEIRNLFQHTCAISPCLSSEFPSKVKRPHFSVLDKSKIKKDLKITIPHWKESLKECVKILSDN
jgi:dTDP-4-dehydrorhamnose reductase